MRRNAISLARYIIDKCMKEGEPISNLQLQKILYYIQVAFLKEFDILCFDDSIEAWRFGPVVRDVYNKYCGFGALPICETYNDNLDYSEKEFVIINKIIEEKRKAKPWDLVKDTHASGKAWDKIYEGGFGNRCEIPIKLLKYYG